MFEIKIEIYKKKRQGNSEKDCFPYDLWILIRKIFNYMWKTYFTTILYFLWISIRQWSLFYKNSLCNNNPYYSRIFKSVLNLFFLMHNFMLIRIIINLIVELSWKFFQNILKTLFFIRLKFHSDQTTGMPCNKI